ncbi:aromatic ring-hydroxylating oxygenase subunit alpha [Nocardioides sp. LHG3406-4]|uniref:aromatic ring-hydroxylating oxygenase subunit alpha n=1 Tax=Nocardioides sp. LHG3406-4 TaxID=2804575 RepID=UPI003CFA536D
MTTVDDSPSTPLGGTVSSSTGNGAAAAPTQSFSVPRRYFADSSDWESELERIFRHSWLFVAHESEIPEPGDYVTRLMGTDQVIVSRTESGDVRTMLNSCTHRGTLLCKADVGNASHFRCGYHGWTFANDGKLTGVPRYRELYGADFDKASFNLRAARTESFHGLLFATFDADQVSLRDYLGDMAFYLECFLGVSAAGTEAPYGAFRFLHQGNWKLEADNFSGDGYHLRHAHRAGFDLGLMGSQAGSTEGVCIQFEHGHTIRAQRTAGVEEIAFPGYPEERWPEIRSQLSPAQVEMFANSTVMHGTIFPNLSFLHTPRAGGFDPGDVDAAMVQLRVFNPVGPDTTDELCWLVAPTDYAEDWKESAFKTMQRQHGATAFFESDDMENFRRMLQVNSGVETRARVAANFDLAHDHAPYEAWFDGPGNIVGSDISEVNQRWFYQHYLDLMEG